MIQGPSPAVVPGWIVYRREISNSHKTTLSGGGRPRELLLAGEGGAEAGGGDFMVIRARD